MSQTQSFYWHDYETWGIDPRRDRAVQFAGIRTDLDFNPIDQPLVIYAKPADDFLPHPQACMVTGITPQLALEEGVPEAEFFDRINQELARPGTCGLGYNSIRFDDEFTRYGLYRNFLDPYAREWKNGNSRWDIIDMVRLTRALRPEGIEWPENEEGVTSFRLELLTAANGIAHEGAHDALVDVQATIALARLVKERQPKLFDFVFNGVVLRQRPEPSALDATVVDEHVPAAVVGRDEAKALLVTEPLHFAFSHCVASQKTVHFAGPAHCASLTRHLEGAPP